MAVLSNMHVPVSQYKNHRKQQQQQRQQQQQKPIWDR